MRRVRTLEDVVDGRACICAHPKLRYQCVRYRRGGDVYRPAADMRDDDYLMVGAEPCEYEVMAGGGTALADRGRLADVLRMVREVYPADHGAEGWPAIQMKDLQLLADGIDELEGKLRDQGARVEVCGLLMEQLLAAFEEVRGR